MKITQVLKEAAQISAAFAFGRFNPAHQGHIAVWRTVENAAARWYIGTNPSTLGPNDPLTFEQKSAWMAEIYPPITGHIAAEQSVMTLAAKIFIDLGKNEAASIAYITDADDWAWSGKLLNQYNGVEGKHGYYKFAEIVHVPSPRVSSATALRDAARADDKVAFYHASGTDPKLKVAGLTYFDTVKQAVTKYPLPVKKAKKVAEGLEYADKLSGLVDLPVFNSATNPNPSGVAKVVNTGDRIMVVMNVRGINVPYYISTGSGGKASVPAGKWYPVFGVHSSGWLNKGGEDSINKFYGSKMLALNANRLNNALGDLSSVEAQIPFMKKTGIAIINKDLQPMGHSEVSANPDEFKKRVNAFLAKLGSEPFYKVNSSPQQPPVAEGAPIVVAQAPIDVRNPKKDQPKQRYMGDIVPDTKPPSTEKRGVKGRAGQRPMPTYEDNVAEASLATMRDYFAGDDNAKDPTKLSQMRDFFNKHKPEGKVIHKNFNSRASYEAWLRQQKMKKIGEDEEAGEVEKTGTLIPFPKGTTKVDVEGEYDWYKLGQVISDLDDADPAQFGTGPASAMIAFGSEAEEHKYLPLLKRLGMRVHDIDQPTEGVEIIPVAEFVTKHLNKTESKFSDYERAVMEGGHSLPEAEKIAGRYDPAEFDSMVQRLGKIAKAGPMKTVWDPEKRVYKTVPDTDKQKKIAEAVIKVVEVIKQRNGLWRNK